MSKQQGRSARSQRDATTGPITLPTVSIIQHGLHDWSTERLHDTFHVSKLKLATDVSHSGLASKQVVIPTDVSKEGEYEVSKILDHDFNKVDKKWYYLISYKGYHELFHSTWEPREFLDNAREIRNAYDKEHEIFVDETKVKEGGGTKSKKRKRNWNDLTVIS